MRPGRPSVRPLAIALGAAALVIAPACMWVIERDAGNRVTVISTPTEWPAGVDPMSPTLTLADGTEVRVDAAYLGWRRVALSPCAEARSFGGVARAHGGTSRNVIECCAAFFASARPPGTLGGVVSVGLTVTVALKPETFPPASTAATLYA